VKIQLFSTPLYLVYIITPDKDQGIHTLEKMIEAVKEKIEASGGNMNVKVAVSHFFFSFFFHMTFSFSPVLSKPYSFSLSLQNDVTLQSRVSHFVLFVDEGNEFISLSSPFPLSNVINRQDLRKSCSLLCLKRVLIIIIEKEKEALIHGRR